MLKLKKIAITGGVASGKSSVCQFFKELGAFVVNADAVVHKLLVPSTDLGQQIIRTLGPDVISDGKISRRIVAEKVFKDPKSLEALERLVHPAVLKEIEKSYLVALQSGKYSSFVVEIPLLFEIENQGFYDVVVAVEADEAVAKKRFAAAGFQPEEYDQRMRRQITPQEKAKRADYVLSNRGSLDDLRKQVIACNQTIHKS